MEDIAARRRELRRETRKSLILEAAATVFAEEGFERATLDGVGERVGLSKASLYYYVDGKEDLLVDLLRRVIESIAETAAARTDNDTDAATRFRIFLKAHVEVTVSTPEGRLLAENIETILSDDTVASLRTQHEDTLIGIIDKGIAERSFTRVHPRAVAKMIFGALASVPLWFDPDGAMSLDDLVDSAVTMMLTGLTEESH